ncbi:FHA domain-containing protein [Pseudanabaena sp. ABRG5-3]|uniref:FHA domain-containing protein n=1 Tax=Pseudanabaena sp. ABRG5-3 TaxID=685565 RepID=UPI000DC72784|nr:FHA domain-containing protein [Pseudanabaena sp. ABRG5-3]BBC23157.1 FHA domain protein [Pseudanabaena sp. ABRG5-3]
MITLNLLHPIEATPIQTWKFEAEPVIRIGRSGDNDVILYSSVVSRYHVELHRQALYWEIVNIGANGTYVNDQQIEKERVQNGITIRLAATGPKLQILLDGQASPTHPQQVSITQPISTKPADNRPTRHLK